ncbi:hypothetical protein C8R46DRAFT_1183731 [Mycena filopes]|nr:hypothetical protein C8R46DRAFT_1183731 [Mycena filopes]
MLVWRFKSYFLVTFSFLHWPRFGLLLGYSETRGRALREFSSANAALVRVPRRGTFPTSANFADNAVFLRVASGRVFRPPKRQIDPAERAWLQREPVGQISTETNQSGPRFDWRKIAPRVKPPPSQTNSYIPRTAPGKINVDWGEPYYDAIQTYTKRFMEMLEAEQQEDEAVLKERLSTWSLTRLQEEGYCLTGLSAFWLDESQFGRPVASFLLGPGLSLPEHRFENSTQVLLSRIDPLNESFAKGAVVSRSATQIRVTFEEQFDELAEGSWRLDVGRSNIVYERMRAAISHLNHDPQMLEARPLSSDRELILQGTHLRDILLHSSQPTRPEPSREDAEEVRDADEGAIQEPLSLNVNGAFLEDQRIQSWARRYSQPEPVVVEGDPPLHGLNTTQIRAIALMIGQRLSLVQGPPGTGKTKTIIETIKLLKVHFQVPHPLLVCTYTNVAVDNLVEGLGAAGVEPLRVGFGGQVKESLVKYTLAHKLTLHPFAPSLAVLREQSEELSPRIRNISLRLRDMAQDQKKANPKGGNSPSAVERRRVMMRGMEADLVRRRRMQSTLRPRIYALEMLMLRDVVSAADVICTTCITSASAALNVVDFPVVFLDEASMSTEPASLIPIMKGCRHLALIGDHKQLPPVITSPEAQALGLGRSLFERLTEEGIVPSIMLDTQYRMHPGISLFPSGEFYNLSLQDGTVDAHGIALPRLTPPLSAHLKEDATGNRPAVIFLDHAGGESLKDKSRVNHNEAQIVMGVVEDLLLNNPALMGQDIGIIAPYVAQISLLTRLFTTDAKARARFNAVLGEHRAMQLAHIEIKTVDGFEGREKEIIVFSTVRNNAGGYIGFLADRRRLNVGLTRAKRGLFVVGSISTLGRGVRAEPKKPAVVEEEASKVAQAKEATKRPLKVVATLSAKGKNKGQDSWKRYAQWLTDRGLVIKLGGDSLGKALYGNLQQTAVAASARKGKKQCSRNNQHTLSLASVGDTKHRKLSPRPQEKVLEATYAELEEEDFATEGPTDNDGNPDADGAPEMAEAELAEADTDDVAEEAVEFLEAEAERGAELDGKATAEVDALLATAELAPFWAGVKATPPIGGNTVNSALLSAVAAEGSDSIHIPLSACTLSRAASIIETTTVTVNGLMNDDPNARKERTVNRGSLDTLEETEMELQEAGSKDSNRDITFDPPTSLMFFNYVAEPNSNLLCCICQAPFIDPATTRTCSHTFCRDCIVKAIGHAPQCPIDRSALSVDDLVPANSIIRSLVDELIVECIHRASGCPHTCQRQRLTAHIMNACLFSVGYPKGEDNQILDRIDAESPSYPHTHTLLPCDLCGVKIHRADLKASFSFPSAPNATNFYPVMQNHIRECTESSVTCEFCSLELPRSELGAHNIICPEAIVPCPQESNGCAWTGPRSTLASLHTQSCPYEAIKGFFAVNATKLERITEENLLLRHKVDTLEGHLQSTKRELQSAKTALGPWYRSDGVYAYSGRPSSDLPADLQPASASSSSTSRRFSLASDAPGPFDHAPQDTLAAYFPSETPTTTPFQPAHARRQTLPAGWDPAFAVGANNNITRASTQHTQTVAPLNLSTTLEGALVGVRESVVALSGTVDSLGRRNEIAVTNEALRLNEEVMSLRANVHGLRMQVHTIMMDRNAQVTGRSAENLSNIDGAWPAHASRFFNYPPMSPGGQSITKL